MEPSQVWQIIVLIILLVLSGFFSMSETALMALSKIRIRHMVEDGVKGAKLVEKLTEDPNKLLGAILIGNNIVNILASSLATTLFVSLVGPSGVGIATGVMTVLVLIFGEITPKSIAKQKSEEVSLKVSKPINIIVKLFKPFINSSKHGILFMWLMLPFILFFVIILYKYLEALTTFFMIIFLLYINLISSTLKTRPLLLVMLFLLQVILLH